MNIQDLGALGEIIGGIAVIATLIYLSVQVRQANVSTHRNMYAQAATATSDFWLVLAQDYELYETFTSMLRAPEDLGDRDLDRAHLVMDSYLSLMESYYLHNIEYGEQLSQERWGRILRRMFGTSGGRNYWQLRRSSFHGEFAEYLDAMVQSNA
jgi:hypothetical protein